MLNQLESEEDLQKFEKCVDEVLKELPKQIVAFLNLKSEMIVIDHREYSHVCLCSTLMRKLNKETILDLLLLIIEQYRDIRYIKQYVKKAVLNLAIWP